MVCFAVLGLRRVYVGGELGGHGWTRPLSAALLVFLWCIFITLVSLEWLETFVCKMSSKLVIYTATIYI